MINEYIKKLWDDYLMSIGENPKDTKLVCKAVDHFEITEESADKLFDLVVQGQKRATAGCLWAYEFDGDYIFQEEDLSIVTNWDKTKGCVIKTKKVQIKKFSEITEEDARVEGEGDLSLKYWRDVHKIFCEHECKRIGKEFSEEILIVFEEFEVVYN